MPLPIASSSGNSTTDIQVATAHGFVAGDIVYHNGTTWLKASAALGTSIAQAVVSQVIDANSFRVVYSGVLTLASHGKTVGQYYYLDQTVAGTTTDTHPTVGIVQQIYHVKDANTLLIDISNAFTAVATAPDVPLTYGRVLALLDLASTTHINTDPGTKIPFTGTTYTSGMTTNAGSIIPSIDGRYRADWLCMAASTDFLADGIFFVVQNGASVGQVSYNMNEASAVNQSAGFIDVDLVAGLEVSLHYRTRHTASDGISWDRGSYFQLTQLPTAVSPIVDVVAEYGEVLPTGTLPLVAGNLTNGSFTLPSAGTWEVHYDMSIAAQVAGQSLEVWIIDSLGAVISGSQAHALELTGGFTVPTLSQTIRITTTGAATYNMRGKSNGATAALINQSGTAAGGGSSRITYTKIAGGLPSTGSTVDKVYVRQTTTQGAPTVGTIINLEQVVSGNIPVVGNTVTLAAGKTYLLEGSGAIMAGGSSTYGTRFYNVTASQFIGDSGFAFSPNNANTPTLVARTAMVEITPTVTTQVQLRVDFLSGSGGIIGGSNLVNAGVGAGSSFDPNGASWVRVIQLGSSAVYAGVYPGTWATYTPVITSTGGTNPTLPTAATITGSYSIQGKTMFLNIRYNSASVTGGTDGTGSYQWSIPGGYSIDLTKAAIPSVITNTAGSGLDGGVVGSGFGRNSGGSNSSGLIVMPLSTTTIGAYFEASTRLMGASSLAVTGASNTTYAFVCQIPLV